MSKTELKNRTLWFDGTSEVSPEDVPELLLNGVPLSHVAVTEPNDDIRKFNHLSEEQITAKIENKQLDMSYNLPERYLDMDWGDKLLKDLWKYIVKIGDAADEEVVKKYTYRMLAEFDEIRSRNMEMLIKTLIYIVDTFKEQGVVWGVGRGSSCASLALFVMGLHKVDPIKYNIPMEEFFHE